VRNVALLLFLANLGFAAWQAWFSGVDSSRVGRSLVSGDPTITLLTESTVPGAEISAEPTVDQAFGESGPPQIASNCISLGPMQNLAVVETVTAELLSLGLSVKRRSVPGEIWLGHWVYIEGIPTRSAADEVVEQLKLGRIDDTYVIDADDEYVVSLGVFTEEARARQRYSAAQQLSLQPTMSDRTRPGDVYWLDVTHDGSRSDALDRIVVPTATPSIAKAACGSG